MAKLDNNVIQFTGTFSNLSAYKMRGHDGIIIRKKGGPTKAQIQKQPKFEKTRNLNNEWKAVCMATSSIRKGLIGLRPLADHNISGPLNALVKKLQIADSASPHGKRSILFSRQPDFLSSFQYNRQTLFDSIIRQPIEVSIDKTSALVDITIPSLQDLVNFFPNPRYAYYRIISACMGLSDYECARNSEEYFMKNYQTPSYTPVQTEWSAAKVLQPANSIQMVPKTSFVMEAQTIIIVGVGIQYGMPGADGTIQPAPFSGAARILKGV